MSKKREAVIDDCETRGTKRLKSVLFSGPVDLPRTPVQSPVQTLHQLLASRFPSEFTRRDFASHDVVWVLTTEQLALLVLEYLEFDPEKSAFDRNEALSRLHRDEIACLETRLARVRQCEIINDRSLNLRRYRPSQPACVVLERPEVEAAKDMEAELAIRNQFLFCGPAYRVRFLWPGRVTDHVTQNDTDNFVQQPVWSNCMDESLDQGSLYGLFINGRHMPQLGTAHYRPDCNKGTRVGFSDVSKLADFESEGHALLCSAETAQIILESVPPRRDFPGFRWAEAPDAEKDKNDRAWLLQSDRLLQNHDDVCALLRWWLDDYRFPMLAQAQSLLHGEWEFLVKFSRAGIPRGVPWTGYQIRAKARPSSPHNDKNCYHIFSLRVLSVFTALVANSHSSSSMKGAPTTRPRFPN